MKSKLILLVAVVVCACFAVQSAPAVEGPGDGCYGGFGYGYGYLYNNLDYKIPYYAAFPPVHYSYPVPRTYGYSPFASPPGTMTPEIIEKPAEPVTIINPHVQGADEVKENEPADSVAASKRQPEPLVIVNPYVKQSGSLVNVSR